MLLAETCFSGVIVQVLQLRSLPYSTIGSALCNLCVTQRVQNWICVFCSPVLGLTVTVILKLCFKLSTSNTAHLYVPGVLYPSIILLFLQIGII